MSDNSRDDYCVQFLLEEYKYLVDSFWKNEETGEKRVHFFITLVTAVIAALVTLTTSDNAHLDREMIRLITIFSLFALLSFGIFTLLRMIRRNRVTDGYKAIIEKIRDRFRSLNSPLLENYYPFGKNHQPRKLWRGGLAETVALINSLIVAALFALLVKNQQKWILVIHGLIGFGLGLIIQFLSLKQLHAKLYQQKTDSKGN